jgi:hypothetical protein
MQNYFCPPVSDRRSFFMWLPTCGQVLTLTGCFYRRARTARIAGGFWPAGGIVGCSRIVSCCLYMVISEISRSDRLGDQSNPILLRGNLVQLSVPRGWGRLWHRRARPQRDNTLNRKQFSRRFGVADYFVCNLLLALKSAYHCGCYVSFSSYLIPHSFMYMMTHHRVERHDSRAQTEGRRCKFVGSVNYHFKLIKL